MEEENKVNKLKKFTDYVDRKFTEKKDDLLDLVQDHFYLFLILGVIAVGFILILLFFRRKRKNKKDEDDDDTIIGHWPGQKEQRSHRNWEIDKGRMIFDERKINEDDEGEEE